MKHLQLPQALTLGLLSLCLATPLVATAKAKKETPSLQCERDGKLQACDDQPEVAKPKKGVASARLSRPSVSAWGRVGRFFMQFAFLGWNGRRRSWRFGPGRLAGVHLLGGFHHVAAHHQGYGAQASVDASVNHFSLFWCRLLQNPVNHFRLDTGVANA